MDYNIIKEKNMTNKFELYKCNICGNVIEVLISGDGHPVCCGEEMERLEAKNDNMNSPDMTEKHTPVITKNGSFTTVTITKHPMEKGHYIVFVQTISKDKNEIQTKYFYPNESVTMESGISSDEIFARLYCNIHGMYVNNA